uniref:Uncharacterized protein n=1 Tax=Panagrellus redivivus TaxID=6233 RepID=A0A7E4VBV6_PANRE
MPTFSGTCALPTSGSSGGLGLASENTKLADAHPYFLPVLSIPPYVVIKNATNCPEVKLAAIYTDRGGYGTKNNGSLPLSSFQGYLFCSSKVCLHNLKKAIVPWKAVLIKIAYFHNESN